MFLFYFLVSSTDFAHSWKYLTKCTKTAQSSSIQSASSEHNSYSIVDDFEQILVPKNERSIKASENNNKMTLKCPNSNDFLFIGLTQYGVSSVSRAQSSCEIKENDCLVTVDYLASQCNGINACDIQLDAQFLHTCKNLSDYLSIAYECIPGSKRINVCSNEETFIIDSTFTSAKTDLNARFGSFYLASPNYPWEYDSNLNNCSCHLEYVEIDGASTASKSDEMNLVFKTLEFDLEDGENRKCNKDKLRVTGNTELSLCGHHSDFEQFYAKGKEISVNFTTDDVITRRGFLVEVAPVAETTCPAGTVRFDESKCVRVYDNQHLTHHQASKACGRQQGKLLKINDFVDNIKLSSLLRQTASVELLSIWADYATEKKSENLSFLNLKKRRQAVSSMGCVSRKASFWTVESCYTKLPYICEFPAVDVRKPSKSALAKNKLIRVSCGKLTSKFQYQPKTAVTTTASSSTTTTTVPTTTTIKSQEKPVLLWSSLVENFIPNKQRVENKEDLTTTTTTTEASPAFINQFFPETLNEKEDGALLSQNLILVIAVVSGVSAIFIIVNIFCIWNYYNKKLNAFIEKSDPEASTYNRTSTLRSSRRVPMNNNRSMSTVDSYVKVLPYSTERCLLNPSSDSSSSGSTSPSQSARNMENEIKLEILRNFFANQKLENQLNLYETLSNYNRGTLNCNFAERVCQVKDCSCSMNHRSSGTTNTSIDSINSAVQLLLNQQLQQQIYEHVTYSDISPTVSMNSQRPLMTFLNGGLQLQSDSYVDCNPKLLTSTSQ